MNKIRVEKEIVVNKSFGGFELSDAATIAIADRKNIKLVCNEQFGSKEWSIYGQGYKTLMDVISRDDPDLINVVREMGDKANGNGARLKIIKVEMVIDLHDCEGHETLNGYVSEVY